jgi:hypothetical protein
VDFGRIMLWTRMIVGDDVVIVGSLTDRGCRHVPVYIVIKSLVQTLNILVTIALLRSTFTAMVVTSYKFACS